MCVYLVDFQQTDEEFDLFLRDAVDDLAVVANQLGDHLGHVQTYVALQRRHTPTHRQHHHSLASTQEGKGKDSPYSIAERRVPELIPVLGSQPAGDVSHKPGGRLPLLSARPAVTLPLPSPFPSLFLRLPLRSRQH